MDDDQSPDDDQSRLKAVIFVLIFATLFFLGANFWDALPPIAR
jgi:hypothetical protein